MFQEENTRNTSNRALFVQFFPFATEVVIVGESDTQAAAEDIDVLAVPPPAGNILAAAVRDMIPAAAVRDMIPAAAQDTILVLGQDTPAAEEDIDVLAVPPPAGNIPAVAVLDTMMAAVRDTIPSAAHDTMLAAEQDTMLAAVQDTTLVAAQDTMLAAAQDNQ